MKTCFRCNETKPLSEFYRHPQMGDGLLGKCKACTKADTAARNARLMADPVTSEQEHERHRMKSRRYRSQGRAKKSAPEVRRAALEKHYRTHPVATKARHAVSNAVRDGRLKRQPCEVCGAVNSQGHHPDHSKPLDVQWLCPPHHAAADNELRKQRRIAALTAAL